MDSSRSSLPNVDRANSTLFKRYLDEQHQSIVKSNNYPQFSRPINSTIQITHTTQRQQQDVYTTTSNTNLQSILVKRKSFNGRKQSGDNSKQRPSHTNRFMKRFQRQHKNGETITNVQKRDGRPRFEFHDLSTIKPTRTEHDTQCTCLASSGQNREEHHHHHHHHHHHRSPVKPQEVPRLSLNEIFNSSTQHRRSSIAPPPPSSSPKLSRSPIPMLPATTDESTRQESISNSIYPMEQNLPSIGPALSINTELASFLLLDPSSNNQSNEYWSLIDDLLQELSFEMSDKASVDILLEIEESLAQRIYDCVIEQDDENENDTKSYSTTTADSSALSAPPPLNNITTHESNDLPPSPISTAAKEPMDNREKYFQPIREQAPPSFQNLLDRNRHSTPSNRISKQLENDARSPFTQSLFEPINLLRTVATNNDFSLFQQPNSKSVNKQSELSNASYHRPLPFLNHLLPPRSTPIDTNLSAFKPIEPANTRSTTSFELKRPQVISSSSTKTNWFGQS